MNSPRLGSAVVALTLLALAVPAFGHPGSKTTRQDAKAESNARNLVSQVEACFTDTMDYTKCRTQSQLEGGMMGSTGLTFGNHAGQVSVVRAAKSSYTVVGYSRSGNHFRLVRTADGRALRRCTKAGRGLCKSNGTW